MKKIISLLLVIIMLCVPVSAASLNTVSVELKSEKYAGVVSSSSYAEGLGLSEEEYDRLEDVIHTATRNCESYCDISSFGIPYNTSSLSILPEVIGREDPLSFHVNNMSVDITSFYPLKIRGVRLSYVCSKAEYKEKLSAAVSAADILLEGIEGNNELGDVEKALLIHDRLGVWTEYDLNVPSTAAMTDDTYTIIGALCNRTCVCEGYAKSYKYLLSRVGIKSRFCASREMLHMWNLVLIDGEWYHVDVTWDDPVYDVTGRVKHSNFLLSTNGIRATGHNGSDFDMTPTSAIYDDAFWKKSYAEFNYIGGRIFYIDNSAKTLNTWDGESSEVVRSLNGKWRTATGGIYYDGFSCLSNDSHYLYYSLPSTVYRFDVISDTVTTMYEYDSGDLVNFSLFGMRTEGGRLICDPFNNCNFSSDTKASHEFSVEYELPSLLGDVNGDGDVDTRDSRNMKKYITDNVNGLEFIFFTADINGDGDVNSKDSRALKSIIVS